MTDVEIILEMAKMQKALDEALLEKGRKLGKIDAFDRERTIFALIDEIGEMVHELKGNWCWWKATQKEVDMMKVLEELVDCWHFALSLDNDSNMLCDDEAVEILPHIPFSPVHCVTRVMRSASLKESTTKWLYKFTTTMGFTMTDIYTGYIAKNKENYARIERGY